MKSRHSIGFERLLLPGQLSGIHHIMDLSYNVVASSTPDDICASDH
jgi:hypothetical protein